MFIARPLYDLVKKNQRWNWIEKQEKLFRELNERFIKELVLVAPDLNLKNEDRSKHIGIYNRRGVVDKMWRWTIEASSILVKIS